MSEKSDTRPAVIVTDAETLERIVDQAVARALERHARGSGEPEPEWIDAEAAGALLGVCSRTITNMATRGDLPARRLGRLWRFRRADVLAALDAA